MKLQAPFINMGNSDFENLFTHSFTEKVTLPQRSTFALENQQGYMIGELKIRKHNGLFWRPYKTKTCVLLNNGYFLIYSTPVEGLSIYLPTVRNLSHRFKGGGSNNTIKARCDVVMCVGRTKLGVLIKGHLSMVVAWRRGIVCSHEGLPISDELYLSNELISNEAHISPEASESLICSLSNRSLPLNSSLPNTSCVRQRKCYSVVCAGLRAHKAMSLDARSCDLLDSRAFATTTSLSTSHISDHRVHSSLPHDDSANDSTDDSAFVSDSVCSPDGDSKTVQKGTSESKTGPKTTEQTPTSDWKYIKWRELTVATKLPMLSAEILNFEAVFHRNDTLKYSTLF